MKGGELASAVHAYTKTGDPSMRSLVRHILSLVSHPVLSFLYRWIYDGELEDTYHEVRMPVCLWSWLCVCLLRMCVRPSCLSSQLCVSVFSLTSSPSTPIPDPLGLGDVGLFSWPFCCHHSWLTWELPPCCCVMARQVGVPRVTEAPSGALDSCLGVGFLVSGGPKP